MPALQRQQGACCSVSTLKHVGWCVGSATRHLSHAHSTGYCRVAGAAMAASGGLPCSRAVNKICSSGWMDDANTSALSGSIRSTYVQLSAPGISWTCLGINPVSAAAGCINGRAGHCGCEVLRRPAAILYLAGVTCQPHQHLPGAPHGAV